MQNMWAMFRLVKDERRRIILLIILGIAVAAVAVAIPYFIKLIVDQVIALLAGNSGKEEVEATLIALFAGMAGLFVLNSIIEFFLEVVADRTFINVLTKLRERIYNHLEKLPIDYYEHNKVGEISSRMTTAPRDFAQWLSYNFGESILISMGLVLFGTILLWTINIWLGLLVTLFLPFGFWIDLRKLQKTKKLRDKANRTADKMWGTIAETITHIQTIRSFAREKYQTSRFQKDNMLHYQLRNRHYKIERFFNFVANIANSIPAVVGMAIATYVAYKNPVHTGSILLASIYLQRVTSNLRPLARFVVNTGYIDTDLKRTVELLAEESDVVDVADAIEISSINEIEFKDVSFRYPGKTRLVLNRVSFKLGRGETLALVGPSGVGKSTITKLLLRFYDVTGGQILINGQDIRAYKQNSLRNAVGMVMQDVALFNDTVKNNLRFAKPSASASKMEAAARLSYASNFINKLPKQYETVVGERGVKLSGGEKQRVAIARAILREPELVILDEATSSLDSESEQYVQAGLQTLLKDRTAIIIAHRLSTVMKADKILVIKGGKVVEEDNHKSLLEKKGHYAKMFELQTSGYK